MLKYFLSKLQIISHSLYRNSSLFSFALRTKSKILSMTHESLKPVFFPPLLHKLFLTFPTALMNLYLASCSFFQTFLCVSSFFHPSYCFFSFSLRTTFLPSFFSLESFWEAIPDLQAELGASWLCVSLELYCHLISAFTCWNLCA